MRYNGRELQMLESKDVENLDLMLVMPMLHQTLKEAEESKMPERVERVTLLIKKFQPEYDRQNAEYARPQPRMSPRFASLFAMAGMLGGGFGNKYSRR